MKAFSDWLEVLGSLKKFFRLNLATACLALLTLLISLWAFMLYGPYPSANDLFFLKATFGGLLADGDFLRALAPSFLHADPIWLALNLVVLTVIGPIVELELGSFSFALLYLFLAANSAFAVGTINCELICVGAQGPLAGLFGALFAIWYFRRGHLHLTKTKLGIVCIGFILLLLPTDLVMSLPRTGLLASFGAGFVVSACYVRPVQQAYWRIKLPSILVLFFLSLTFVLPTYLIASPKLLPEDYEEFHRLTEFTRPLRELETESERQNRLFRLGKLEESQYIRWKESYAENWQLAVKQLRLDLKSLKSPTLSPLRKKLFVYFDARTTLNLYWDREFKQLNSDTRAPASAQEEKTLTDAVGTANREVLLELKKLRN